MYKQDFIDENASDSSVFITSFVSIKLTSNSNIIWINQNSSSTRYCRSIRFEFIYENAEICKKEFEKIEHEIKSLIPIKYKNIIVNYEMLFTMIDGKICTYGIIWW